MSKKLTRDNIEGPSGPIVGYWVDLAKSQKDQLCPVSGQTPVEDIFNILTHGLAFLFCLPILGNVFWPSAIDKGPAAGFWTLFFALSVTGMFGASASYHICRQEERKRWVRGWDHAFIYFVIASTYGTFAIAGPQTAKAIAICGAVTTGGLALAVAEIRGKRFGRVVATAIYCTMAGSALLAAPDIYGAVSSLHFGLLVSGLICYLVGVGFYLYRELAYHHVIWHLFVILGAFLHGVAIPGL